MVLTKVPAYKCCGCHACAAICPQNCIRMMVDEEGFLHPVCDETACVNCNRCETVCPLLQERKEGAQLVTEAYAVINQDEHVRMSSSSGGVFTALAIEVLRQGGVVFGVSFAEDFKSVQHICINHSDDIEKLRGSKYMQSEIGNAYALAKEYLDNGRTVYFSGTPCQIGGLNAFLGKKYDNLYTQDIICHGVPSALLWKRYLGELESETGAKVSYAEFRCKETGWKKYSLKIVFFDGVEHKSLFFEDPFLKAFLGDYCLRPSCYNCAFKSIRRQSDITLGDFWGIENELPEMYDDKGTSLVLIHSDKGRALFKSVSDTMTKRSVFPEVVLKHNPSAVQSAKLDSTREKFFSVIQKRTIANAVKKIEHRNFLGKLIGKVKKVIVR